MIRCLRSLGPGLRSVDGASVWMQHLEFGERAAALASHLEAAISLASTGHWASAFAVARVGLEHQCLDELLLLADRYREDRKVDDVTFEAWKVEYEARVEEWTETVVSFDRSKKLVRMVRTGYPIKDDAGVVVEQLSPYYPAMQHHNATLGPANVQEHLAPSFSEPGHLAEWATRNRGWYDRYLKWSSIVDNLTLNSRVTAEQAIQLGVHYRFLSAFVHATDTGYDMVNGRGAVRQESLSRHLFGELALLYLCVIAVAEMLAFFEFVDARPKVFLEGRDSMNADCAEVAAMTSYLWFPRLGAPTVFDRFEQANRSAHDGGRGVFPFAGARRPNEFADDEVGYYRDPLERLGHLHQGLREFTTSFGFDALW